MLIYPLITEVNENTHAAIAIVMVARIAKERVVLENTASHRDVETELLSINQCTPYE